MADGGLRSAKSVGFRGDIQGLRAVGALLVAGFHIWIGRVSGGVDVFFVVSGYLMLGSLVREGERSGAIDLIAFAGRLFQRLLPACYAVLAVVMLTTPFWLPQTRWELFVREAIASAAYLENWWLAFSAVDYLAREEVQSSLQHYWAMSVQLQSMAVFAVALAAASWLSGRWPSRRRSALVGTLAAVFGLSLAYAIYGTVVRQPFAYFDTFARLWEFAMGGLVATLLPRGSGQARLWATLGGWAGLAMVVSCGFLLPVSTSFPGVAALWPTLGATLVLICGGGRGGGFGVERLLASRPMTWLGDNSYALYLWHWPILIFYLTHAYRTKATLAGGLVVLGVALALAVLTTKFVEGPVRARPAQGRWRPIQASAAALACLCGVAGAGQAYLAWAMPRDRLAAADPARYPGAAAFDRPDAVQIDAPIRPGPLWVRRDLPDLYADDCQQTLGGSKPITCTYGDPAARHTLALVGGSHSAQWLPALQVLLKDSDWKIVTYTKSSCLFSAGATPHRPSCAQWNAGVMAELERTRPALVFTTATSTAGEREETPAGFVVQWRALQRAGIEVAAIRDTPRFGFVVAECVALKGPDSPACARPRKAVLADGDLTAALAAPGLTLIDLSRYFCDPVTCPPTAGNILIYRDKHHISTPYARSLAPMLGRELTPVLRLAEDARRPQAAQLQASNPPSP